MIATHSLADRINGAIDRVLIDERLVGSVVLIAHRGEVIYRRAAGFADRESKRVLKENDIFRLASLSKTLVSAAAMALIEQGRLQLDDALSRYLPAFRPKLASGAEALITVRQLLTHTAGLTYAFLQPAGGPYSREGVGDGLIDRGFGMEEQLRRLEKLPLSFPPGTIWNYSVAIDVLGAVIAAAFGKPLPEAMRELITAPLGMQDTGFTVQDAPRLVVPYADAKPPRRMADPDRVEFGAAVLNFSPGRAFDPEAFPSGGAGMVGSATEYLHFLETLRSGGGKILKPATVRSMMSNQIGALRVTLEPTPAWGFGFGGAVLIDAPLSGLPQSAGTYKWGGVYGHHWYIDVEQELTVLAMSNTTVEGMAGAFVAELMAAVYGH
jgi:CubicO group peptidase (beta-lactamase class C family)